MPAQNQHAFRPQEIWHPDASDTGKLPGYELHSWLTEEGLLTERLRGMYGDGFSLRLLKNGSENLSGHPERHILLCRDGEPVVYANTDIPKAAAVEYPWLNELGEQPIGEALRDRGSIERNEFTYGLVPTSDLPDSIQGSVGTDELWARHYIFTLGAHEIAVTEVFLPALTGLRGEHTEDHGRAS